MENCVPESIRIVTYNVLSDEHEKELIKTHLRIPAIITQLEQTKANIIVLQEATVPLLQALMREHWVKQMYISESWEGTNIEPQGIIILAKWAGGVYNHSDNSRNFSSACKHHRMDTTCSGYRRGIAQTSGHTSETLSDV